jgi:hypothetical protein
MLALIPESYNKHANEAIPVMVAKVSRESEARSDHESLKRYAAYVQVIMFPKCLPTRAV